MSAQPDRRSEELRLRVVRRSMRHDSAPKHVAGSATFIDDIREPEGLLHIAVGGAPVAAGQLLGVDLDAVRAAPGVVAVLTAADIPGKNDVSPVAGDDPVFVDGPDRVPRTGRLRGGGENARRGAPRRKARQGRGRDRPALRLGRRCARRRHPHPARLYVPQGRQRRRARRKRESRQGPAAHRRPGAFLSRRPGLARHSGRGRRHAGPLLDPAPERGAASGRQGARKYRSGRDGRGAAHGRRVRRQGDAGRAMGRDRGARRARHRQAVQDPARPRRRHVPDRQAARFSRRLRGRLRREGHASRRSKP